VQDCAAPYLDASLGLSNFDKCGPHLGSPTPISNYRELGLDPMAAYFNSGVLVVDLEAWRNADLPRKMLNCLDRHRDHVRWWDQYALNVVLSGQWKPLDPRWNQGSHVYVFRNWTQSPYNRDTFLQVLDDPYIIHFTTRYKPWKVSCLHPLRHQFYRYVDRTEWAGWRPAWFNHPRSVLELLQAQQRRLRFARRRLQGSLLEWLQSLRWKEAKRLP
jgi:lipopolysaccharide biosynthesis glycosyltransferase